MLWWLGGGGWRGGCSYPVNMKQDGFLFINALVDRFRSIIAELNYFQDNLLDNTSVLPILIVRLRL